jgi:Holliday junction resolvase RusA-like endonuclease
MIVVRGVNPVPWKSPNAARVGRGVKVYKDSELRHYQEALAEAVRAQMIASDRHEGELSLTLYFWRQLDEAVNVDTGRRRRAHVADATNLQKATEDALQGILFDNDRQVVHAESWIMAQGADVVPLVVIELGPAPARPATLLALAANPPEPVVSTNQPEYRQEALF